MDEQQRRISEDLAGIFKGEFRFSPLNRSIYASDASLYQIAPLGVAFPRNEDDVITLAKYAREHDLPLIPRGAGTGLAGSALGKGLVVDFSRHMHQILSCGDDSVTVQPGVVLSQLNRVLKEYGRYFPPDPSNAAVTTIGGMMAVDAAGSHSIRVGSTRDHVKEIGLVLSDGTAFSAGNELLTLLDPTRSGSMAEIRNHPAFKGETDSAQQVKRTIISKLRKLLVDHADLIRERQSPLVRNCCGYFLRGVLSETHLNLPRLLTGSEGTLAMFTSATLHTAQLPAHRGVVLLLFLRLEDAIKAIPFLTPQQPSACDLLDRRLLSLAREADTRFAERIHPNAEAALIVETTGFSEQQVKDRIRMAIEAVRGQISRVLVAQEAYSEDDVELLWSLPHKVVPLLTRLKGEERPQPFVEDLAVPPDALNDFLVRAQKVFQKHKVTASMYAHAAAGQLHMRPFLPAPGPKDGQRLEAIARDLYQAVFFVGGSISGEHGDGLARTAFIRSQYGNLYKVFQQIKDLFDPRNLLNPGKIVSDDPHLTISNFRPQLTPEPKVTNLQLTWSPQQLSEAVSRCNGCGECRTQEPGVRMCPFFHLEPAEAASPRSKANVMRDYLTGQLPPDEFASDDMRKLVSLCFNCKQCHLECPSEVNIPQMVIESRAAYVAANGLSRADWILSRAHSFGSLCSTLAMGVNALLGSPLARWVIEKLFGVARNRKLPRFAQRSFLRAVPRELTKPPEKNPEKTVVYFVDHFANYHDPELAKALIAVLQHNGYRVYVPPHQTGSGMAMVSTGDLDAARDVAEQNIRELAAYAREGCWIICTEPAAALCLREEYPMVIDHPDTKVVAQRVIEAGKFLMMLKEQGKLKKDFAPLKFNAAYHTPCHLKALKGGTPFFQLMSLIPELNVHKIEKGCSGMAGTFGLTAEHFQTSLRIGWGLISHMQSEELDFGLTECSSCKIQMEQRTTTPTLHPLKLMALAYGLMPEIRQKLQPARRKLVIT